MVLVLGVVAFLVWHLLEITVEQLPWFGMLTAQTFILVPWC